MNEPEKLSHWKTISHKTPHIAHLHLYKRPQIVHTMEVGNRSTSVCGQRGKNGERLGINYCSCSCDKAPYQKQLERQGFTLLPSLKAMVHQVGEGKCMWTQSMRCSQLEGKCSHACVHACVPGDIPRVTLASRNSCLVGVGIPLRLMKTVWSYGTVRAARLCECETTHGITQNVEKSINEMHPG